MRAADLDVVLGRNGCVPARGTIHQAIVSAGSDVGCVYAPVRESIDAGKISVYDDGIMDADL
jgi:hypothetical protein